MIRLWSFMTLQNFTADRLLPPGDYPLTLKELGQSYLVTGAGVSSQSWDSAWRKHLVDNLAVLVDQLWKTGVTEIFIDGSFTEHYGFGPGTGIKDQFGNDLLFPSAFRISRRDNKPRGIIKIVPEGKGEKK